MPAIVSSPLNSCSRVEATKASHGSPAATVSTAPEQEATSLSMPRVATLTTVPSNPESATSRFEPPPRMSTGSPAASRSRTACTRSPSVSGVSIRRTGPPTRRVVWAASRSGAALVTSSTEIHLGAGRTQHLLPVADRVDAHRHQAALDRRHRPAEDHLGTLGVVGDHHGLGETDEVGADPRGVAHPVGHHPQPGAHREQAVGDHPGQPNPGGEVVGVVDRVEVAGGTRVADQVGPGEPDGERRQGGPDLNGPDLDGGGLDAAAHGLTSRPWKKVALAVQTGSPASVRSATEAEKMSVAPRLRTLSMVRVACTRSPTLSSRVNSKRWSPWMTRRSARPSSGSSNMDCQALPVRTAAKVGGATASAPKCREWPSPSARANSATFAADTSYGGVGGYCRPTWASEMAMRPTLTEFRPQPRTLVAAQDQRRREVPERRHHRPAALAGQSGDGLEQQARGEEQRDHGQRLGQLGQHGRRARLGGGEGRPYGPFPVPVQPL